MGKAGTKKTPVKKADKGPEKPVKRLGSEKKPTVAVRKSTRNNPGTSKEAPEETKAVKVSTGSKGKANKKKKVAEDVPEVEDHSDEPEEAEAKPEETEAKSSTKAAKSGKAKVSKVSVEHCKS